MKKTVSIIAILVGMISTGLYAKGTNHDSILEHGNKTSTSLKLNLDSLTQIGIEEEQPVMDVLFMQKSQGGAQSKVKLIIYGQHLSEPKESETSTFEVL